MNEFILCVFALGDKLEQYCSTLEKQTEKAALGFLRPAMDVAEEIMKLNEKKRLAVNLYVMYRRMGESIGEEGIDLLKGIARGQHLEDFALRMRKSRMSVHRLFVKLLYVCRQVLSNLHQTAVKLEKYKKLTLFDYTLKRLSRHSHSLRQKVVPSRPIDAAYAVF